MTRLRGYLLVLATLLLGLPAQATGLTDLETTPKSLFFGARCLAPIMLREPINTKDLREMPVAHAVHHLYGQSGKVWFGADDSLVLVAHDAGASCGINVFDEDIAEVERFMAYWLERDDSPFARSETKTLASGDKQIFYDGFCEKCGFHVHARAHWIAQSRFTIYRVFATLPEKS